jgi:ribonuclease P protein component
MPYAYRKSERLRKNADFTATMKEKRLSIDGLSLFYRRNDAGGFRVGISVGKKLGNAVKRNRLRRRIRACVGKALTGHAAGFDLVFLARNELMAKDFPQICQAVNRALQRSAVLSRGSDGGKK